MDYRDALEETAGPLQEKSITAVESALKLAHENGVYNKVSKKAATLLVKLDPGRFPVLSDEVVNTQYRTPATFSTKPSYNPATKLNRNPPPPPMPATPEQGEKAYQRYTHGGDGVMRTSQLVVVCLFALSLAPVVVVKNIEPRFLRSGIPNSAVSAFNKGVRLLRRHRPIIRKR